MLNPGSSHYAPTHILSGEDAGKLDDSLLYVHLFTIQMVDDYFEDIVQFLSTSLTPPEFTVA
jgi:hypothetical protein